MIIDSSREFINSVLTSHEQIQFNHCNRKKKSIQSYINSKNQIEKKLKIGTIENHR